MMSSKLSIVALWDRFLFQSCDPRIVPFIRISFALLVVIQTAISWIDAAYWFTNEGVLRTASAQTIVSETDWSLLYVLPSTVGIVRLCLGAIFAHAFLMLVGFYSRLQAAAIFIWLVSFQNRNPLIFDGEDTLFRIFAFILIWLPLDQYFALRTTDRRLAQATPNYSSAWAIRLMQFQMTAVYASTFLSKLQGSTWHDGSALWYVSRMTDNYGRFIPSSLFDIYSVSAAATWGTLIIEGLLPIALWIRPLRKWAIIAAFALHLGIELSMNLFLFQWIMMLGLLSFVIPHEWTSRKPTSNASSDNEAFASA
jgi:hypothetical protein